MSILRKLEDFAVFICSSCHFVDDSLRGVVGEVDGLCVVGVEAWPRVGLLGGLEGGSASDAFPALARHSYQTK